MPWCQGCGAHVTAHYVRVMAVDEDKGIQVCPECPDRIRGKDGRPRSPRGTRRNHEKGEVDHERNKGTKFAAKKSR